MDGQSSDVNTYDVIVIGGGASGFFTAINCKQKAPHLKVAILEKSNKVLAKVKISGGGRCNITHAEFIPKELSTNYPRGQKELLGPFHTFMTGDTMEWFEQRNVPLKIENDGRIFPVSNSSQQIIDCFLAEAKSLDIPIYTKQNVKQIEFEDSYWKIHTPEKEYSTQKLVIATGSSPGIWKLLSRLGLDTEPPVPSLFTFDCPEKEVHNLAGISRNVQIKIPGTKLVNDGALLFTHWGFSGPAVLKLSAWGARILHEKDYQFQIAINWLPDYSEDELFDLFKKFKQTHRTQKLKTPPFDFQKRFWPFILNRCGLSIDLLWEQLSEKKLRQLIYLLRMDTYQIKGKSTFKEEFVTAGGVALHEIHFKTFEAKKHPGLYLVGEVLNVDAVTGGFNFQNAWTSGYIAAQAIANVVDVRS